MPGPLLSDTQIFENEYTRSPSAPKGEISGDLDILQEFLQETNFFAKKLLRKDTVFV